MWEGVIASDSGCDGLTQGTVGGVERKRWGLRGRGGQQRYFSLGRKVVCVLLVTEQHMQARKVADTRTVLLGVGRDLCLFTLRERARRLILMSSSGDRRSVWREASCTASHHHVITSATRHHIAVRRKGVLGVTSSHVIASRDRITT